MNITRRTIQALGLVLVLVGLDLPLHASDWRFGDIFAAVGNGQYKVYDNSGVFKETITDSQGNGLTAGCALDSSFHLYTTNFTNTKVVKFALLDPHDILQTIDTTSPNSLDNESIVFAGNGNFYVGHADGDHLVHRYNAAGVLQQTYAVATENRGSDWIDLAVNQKTLFYTSEGRRIKRFDVSVDGGQLADFATLDTSDPLYALRLLPPGDGTTGGLLVANTTNIKRLNGSGGVVRTYGATGENLWFALSLDSNISDPDPTKRSFWAGDLGTGHLYRFNIDTGAIEVGPISTGASPGALGGICAYGALSPAQPAPIVQRLFLTPDRPTGTVFNDNNNNQLSVTLNELGQDTTVTVRFTLIDPSVGVSDCPQQAWFLPCAPCIIVSSDGTKCAIHQLEGSTTNYSSVHLYRGWVRKGTRNPRMLKNGIGDITTRQFIDPGDEGDTPGISTFSDNEAPLPSGTICNFYPQNGSSFQLGSMIPVSFQAATGEDCTNGPFITDVSGANPRLSLAKKDPDTLLPVPQTVMAAPPSTDDLFAIDGITWRFNWSTQNLTTGDYILTAFDLTDNIPPISVTIRLFNP